MHDGMDYIFVFMRTEVFSGRRSDRIHPKIKQDGL